MRKTFTVLFLCKFIILFLGSCGSYSNKSDVDFIKVNNTKFELKGKPYFFSGANMWYAAYLGADDTFGGKQRLLRELDRLKKIGISNLRILAASEESDYSFPINPPFQYKNGKYNEQLLLGLDFLLVEMKKRNMYAVLYLNNYWDWSGGMGQYVAWTTNTSVCDPYKDTTKTWKDYLNYTSNFYENQSAQLKYKKYIEMIVNRTNSFNKEKYKDDPTIMAWELANEPRPNPNDTIHTLPLYFQWIDSTAKYIHDLDRNHLVTTGSEGAMGSLGSISIAKRAHQSKYVDYVVFHLWPQNWSWFVPDSLLSISHAEQKSKIYIEEHIELAKILNKPLVLEEFGLSRDYERYNENNPITMRNRFYKYILDYIEKDISNQGPIAGFNFWAWSGEGRAIHADSRWRIGDKVYLGDPFPEHQGVNSVYDSDSSTIQIIRNFHWK